MEIKTEILTVTLTNSKQYPFNDSEMLVAFKSCKKNQTYFVYTELCSSDGEIGDIVVTDKAINGLKIAYTGSAKTAVIKCCVIGD